MLRMEDKVDLGVTEESTIYSFALSYREACKAVQDRWAELLTSETGTAERKERVEAYVAAQRHAKDVRASLLAAASGGIPESPA